VTEAVLTSGVAEGILELEEAFPERVRHEPDGNGGAYVTVTEIPLGARWTRESSPLSFHLPYSYPNAAPYPYYLPGDLDLTGPWPQELQRVTWRERDAIQVSLRHTNWDPDRDRVLGCVWQVAERLRGE
jgi:hypothetical protein